MFNVLHYFSQDCSQLLNLICSFFPGAEPAGIRGITRKLLDFLKKYVNHLPFIPSDQHELYNEKAYAGHHENIDHEYHENGHHEHHGNMYHDHLENAHPFHTEHIHPDFNDHIHEDHLNHNDAHIDLTRVFDEVMSELHAAFDEGEINYDDFQTGIGNLKDITLDKKGENYDYGNHEDHVSSDDIGTLVFKEVMNELEAALNEGQINYDAFKQGIETLKDITQDKELIENGFVDFGDDLPGHQDGLILDPANLQHSDFPLSVDEPILNKLTVSNDPLSDPENIIILPDMELTTHLILPNISNDFKSEIVPSNQVNGIDDFHLSEDEYDHVHSEELSADDYHHSEGLGLDSTGPSMFTSEQFHGDIFFNSVDSQTLP